MKYINLKLLLIGIFFVLTISSLYISYASGIVKDTGSQDFQWGPSKILLEHGNPYAEYFKYEDGERENPFILVQYPNYPSSGYVFLWPYASMDWENAKRAWWFSNIIFTILIVVGLQLLFPIKKKYSLLLIIFLFIGSSPWRSVLANGQHGLFSLVLFIWSVYFVQKRWLLAGILLAMSWFKYTLTFPLSLYFLYKKEYKIVLLAICVHVFLTLFVSYWIDESIADFFLGPLRVAMIVTPSGDIDIFGVITHFSLPKILGMIMLFIIIASTVMIAKQKQIKVQEHSILLMSYLSMVALTIFYHLNYDFVILIFPLWFVFYYENISKLLKVLILSLIAIQWYITAIVGLVFRKIAYEGELLNESIFIVKLLIAYGLFYALYKQIKNKENIRPN